MLFVMPTNSGKALNGNDRAATKWERKIHEFSRLFQRLSQQKVYVIMTFTYQGSFHINYYS